MNLNQEVEKLKEIRSSKKRNTLNLYIIESGGFEGFRKKYKTWKQFDTVLKHAGYSRRYRRELSNQFKEII